MEILSKSAAQTKKIGARIGRALKTGDVVALTGDLGAGKTTLVKGIAAGLGVKEKDVASPTFVLIHEYEGRKKIYHIDWYRLKEISSTDRLLAEDCFNADAITLVEWADRALDLLPKHAIRVELKHKGESERLICIASSARSEA